jgi:hypothetical protein
MVPGLLGENRPKISEHLFFRVSGCMTPHPKVEMIKLEGDFEVHADILTMHISCCSWEPIFGMHHPLRSKLSSHIPASNMGDDLKPAVLSAKKTT